MPRMGRVPGVLWLAIFVGGSAAGQYLPFFFELKGKSLLEPFTYVATSSLRLPGSSEWLAAHTAKVDGVKKWLAAKPAP
jgi:hypothetical protein